MKFDIKKAIQQAKEAMKSPLLEAIVLGPSGSGKSSLLGSFGVKTLYLYGTGESHGPKAAFAQGREEIIPVCIDADEAGNSLHADEVMGRITDILTDHNQLKDLGIKAIALDGLAVMESLVKQTTLWSEGCKTSSGKHNTFKETEQTAKQISFIVDLLKSAQRNLGVHIAVTCMLNVKGMGPDGEYLEAEPRLLGYGLAESLLQQFGDVLVVGKMSRKGVTKYKLQFMTDLSKSSKDESGDLKKAMNFQPRLSGLKVPAIMDADLKEVIKYKEENLK